ncbi:hypothetical protein EJ110_NYTH00742 [Nymphaea thermarum]|nr:hypothetical protein EJ110_NYTH00742 [Nymphaea thermarum]
MAAGYYYHQHNRQSGFLGAPYSSSVGLPPLPLLFFSFILVLFLSLSWYMSYESAFEGLIDQIKMVLMVSPLVLLLVVQWLSGAERRWLPYVFPLPERDSIHRTGSSPWGVALLLVVLMFMISYQSYFHERWFPLLSRA